MQQEKILTKPVFTRMNVKTIEGLEKKAKHLGITLPAYLRLVLEQINRTGLEIGFQKKKAS